MKTALYAGESILIEHPLGEVRVTIEGPAEATNVVIEVPNGVKLAIESPPIGYTTEGCPKPAATGEDEVRIECRPQADAPSYTL